MKNLAVFFGGKSTEHDVSIVTAFQMINFLKQSSYNIYPIYFTHENKPYLLKDLKFLKFMYFGNRFCSKFFNKIVFEYGENALYVQKRNKLKKICDLDVGLNCFHGAMGEDGTFSGLCELLNLPITSGCLSSMNICMDKTFTKMFCECQHIKITKYKVIRYKDYLEKDIGVIEKELSFDYPVIIKPATLGSSIGVSSAENREELKEALSIAFEFDENVIIEEKVQNLKEYNCSVIGSSLLGEIKVSDVEEPNSKGNLLSFEDKYLKGGNGNTKNLKVAPKFGGVKNAGMANLSRNYPAQITNLLRKQIQNITLKLYKTLGLSGVCRVDFLYDEKTHKLYVNEINTVPGSLAYYFWTKEFNSECSFLTYLIELAQKEFNCKKRKKFDYFSSILDNLKF